ncbi:MAG: DNA-binding protein [Methanothrix sp.]|nr:MAG: DNA-binding protein [Methanothrix sp.]
MKIERRWLTASEVGEYLALHPKSVYRACRNHKIPFSKAPGIGVRVDKVELDQLLERLGFRPEQFGESLKKQDPNYGGK